MDKEPLIFPAQAERFDNFTATSANGRFAFVDKKRDIAAELRGELGELRIRDIDRKEFAQRQQDRRRVAAAAAETRPDWNPFFEGHGDTGIDAKFLQKERRGAISEIVLVHGQGLVRALQVDAAFGLLDFQIVAEGNRGHESVEIVEAVGPFSDDVQIEINLGWCKLFHLVVSHLTEFCTMATDKLIVALDMDSGEQALALVRQLKDSLSLFKVGNQLFTREGPALVRQLRREGVDIFLDLKFHDIPQTVVKAVTAAKDLEVRYVTIHTGGGSEMVAAAQEAVAGSGTELLGVTVLTSLDDEALREIGFDHTAQGQVIHLAQLAVNNGLGGLVCSPLEIELIRNQIKKPVKLVTPGIRSAKDLAGDQKRTLPAAEALRRGATHLVVGRPITAAADPAAAARSLLSEIGL